MSAIHRMTLISLAAGALLAACGASPPAPRSVQFFLEHPDIRASTLQACRSKSEANPDCENAAAAGVVHAQHEPAAAPVFPTAPAH